MTNPAKLSYNDEKHKYWLYPEADSKAVVCTGVSSLAKLLDNTYLLDQWDRRMIALGMAMDPELCERAAAHHDDKSELNAIAAQARAKAKAHEKRDKGTAVHRIFERHDLGEDIIDTPQSKAYRAAYAKALEAAGLEVVPEYVERIVCYPKHFVAGRLDRIYRMRKTKKFVLGDVKSGTNAVRYPHATALQLAAYAYAPLMAGPIARAGGTTEEFTKLPENLDKKNAYVVHAPDPDHVEVVRIPIERAWKVFSGACIPGNEWRKLKAEDLVYPVGSIEVADLAAPARPERVAWIKGRLKLLSMVEGGKSAAAKCWPSDSPLPREYAKWTEADIDAIDIGLQRAEKNASAPFGDRDPAFDGVPLS